MRFSKSRVVFGVLLCITVPPAAIAAAELVEFADGDVISASDINGNFAALNAELSELRASLEALESDQAASATRLAQLEALDDGVRVAFGYCSSGTGCASGESNVASLSEGTVTSIEQTEPGIYSVTFATPFPETPVCTCSAATATTTCSADHGTDDLGQATVKLTRNYDGLIVGGRFNVTCVGPR